MEKPTKKYLSKADALVKLQRFCAYQERCHREVRSKLLDLGIYGNDLEEIIAALISDNFLNEERYARTFARGKFRIKQWGRQRILRELKQRDISEYCLRKAMEEIGEVEYQATLKTLLEKKAAMLGATNEFERKHKLAKFGVQHGFEPDLVWNCIDKMM